MALRQFKFVPKDRDGIDALAAAVEADTHLILLRASLPPDTHAVLQRAVDQLRWITESRARWMDACSAQQISVYEEEKP